MPRCARIVLPDYPHHIVHRGHNKQAVFLVDADYRCYLNTLIKWRARLGVRIYAFCLMTNHVHLIVDPGSDESRLAELMKNTAAQQTRYFNHRHNRTGTLWESRYRSSPIETDCYLLACSRYIDLNPVRAGMVVKPDQYAWSSYSAKIGQISIPWLDLDPCYLALAPNAQQRSQAYKDFVESEVPKGEWELIRNALHRGQLTGTRPFVERVGKQTGRDFELRGRGRPRKTAKPRAATN